jgi:hypothetical protein
VMQTKIYKYDFSKENGGRLFCCESGDCDKNAYFKAEHSSDPMGFFAFCFKHANNFARKNGLSFRVSRGDICRSK